MDCPPASSRTAHLAVAPGRPGVRGLRHSSIIGYYIRVSTTSANAGITGQPTRLAIDDSCDQQFDQGVRKATVVAFSRMSAENGSRRPNNIERAER